MNQNIKTKRNAMLGKLFCEAAARGMSAEFVRDTIAPNQIGKRLSAASEAEIAKVLEIITGPERTWNNRPKKKKYASTMDGFRSEICDLAKERFASSTGSGCSDSEWEVPLNNFCRRFGIQRWQWLDVSHGKEVKAAILRLNREGEKDADNGECPF